ncbi:MAG TPA: uroporphyrinogen-III synthase [Acidimicrobiales bacterium]
MESLPLTGFTIAVTADRRAEDQAVMLRRRGADVVMAPVVATAMNTTIDDLVATTERVIATPPDRLVVNSGVGLRAWFDVANVVGLGTPLLAAVGDGDIVCRGAKALGAATALGLTTSWQPTAESTAEIVTHLSTVEITGSRVVIVESGRGAEHSGLSTRIEEMGATVVPITPYRTSASPDAKVITRLVDDICAGRLDAVTFTSAAAMRVVVDEADDTGRLHLLAEAFERGTGAMCMGPSAARPAEESGIEPWVAPAHRLGLLVADLERRLRTRVRELRLGTTTVRIQGTMVFVDDSPIRLTDRERSVLGVLADRPGHVVSKRELLRHVWRGTGADVHAVEMTVTRLRRKLGTAGSSVETVVRRGYRIAAHESAMAVR